MEKTVTISERDYDRLIKLAVYVNDWHPSYVSCKHCGYYHPIGCICLECGKSNCD